MNSPASVCEFLRRAAGTNPSGAAVVTDGKELSYRTLQARAGAVGAALAGLGAGPRRVALLCDNGPVYVILYWGVLLAGGVSVELNPGLGDAELSAQLRDAGPLLLIADPRHRDRLAAMGLPAEGSSILVRVAPASSPGSIFTGAAGEVSGGLASSLGTITDGGADEISDSSTPLPGADDLASIVYTSGTTGRTKGVCLTHRNLAWTTVSIAESFGFSPEGPAERFAGNLPLFYTYGKSALHLAVYLAAPIVFSKQLFTPDSFLDRMRSAGVTHLSLVPYLCNLLMRSTSFNQPGLPAVRRITVAGGGLAREPLEEMLRRFPERVVPMYGLTEASTRVVCMPAGEAKSRPGSCGRAIPGVQVRIFDDDGATLGPGEEGEVAVRGPNVMRGYLDDDAGTSATLRGEWLLTGDIGSLDGDGYLTISGRRKEMIKVLGESVSAFGIEEVIAALPGVAEVAVTGFPHPVSGEAIGAFVVLQPGATVSEDEIRLQCASGLGRARVPARIRFLEELPKTSSGKVRKSLLCKD